MSFEVDRYSSAWAHIALCADLTWATEPPDEFIIANQRLWAQHCRVAQVLQDSTIESHSLPTNNQCEILEKRSSSSQIQENGSCSGRRSVKDVIPESRLAQYYGNFYYDEGREKCYTNTNDKNHGRGYSGQGCETSDLTECWMLPEVEYWFRKLVDEQADRSLIPRRRRQYRMMAEDDFESLTLINSEYNGHRSAASERWGLAGGRAAGEEAALAARVLSVRGLWGAEGGGGGGSGGGGGRAPSPPPPPRKMRARRRQPRRLQLPPPPPAYCLDAAPQLYCDPACKFQFEAPRPPALSECQRAMGRLSASVQAVVRAGAARCPPYRGTAVSRYAPTQPRLAPRYVWWPRDPPAAPKRLDHRAPPPHPQPKPLPPPSSPPAPAETPKPAPKPEMTETNTTETTLEEPPVSNEQSVPPAPPEPPPTPPPDKPEENTPTPKEKVVTDQTPSTSAAAIDTGLRKKRLYSTVLSMSAPAPIGLAQVGCVRLSQKLVPPALLKLNPKVVLGAARLRPPNVDNRFEELEKEALEQYKASDESIDTKFRELEKQAVEQYSASNSNTSCSSGHSAEKRAPTSPPPPPTPEEDSKKQPPKFHKPKPVDSVVIYSQNFPDLNAKGHTTSVTNLKNFHTPPRGEKKEQTHRSNKSSRTMKSESQRAASDTDYESKEARANHKGPLRWTLHVGPPKKRHLAMCVSDFSSDEELDETGGGMKGAGPCGKGHAAGKVKLSAHGGGDLHPLMRNT